MRLVRFIGLLALSIAALLPFGGPAAAAEPGPAPHPSATMSATQLGVVTDTVVCALQANQPQLVYAGAYRLVATGILSSCSPHAPATCSTQAELLIYSKGDGAWLPAGWGNTNYSCPPPAQGSSGSVGCTPSSTTYLYRTRVVATIIYGTTSTASADSASLSAYCL